MIVVMIFLPAKFGRGGAEKIELIVEKGSSSWTVSGQLAEKNLIRSQLLFELYALIRGKIGKLQAGKYMISPTLNIPAVLDMLSKGFVVVDDVNITIPEGLNIAEIGEILEKAGLVKATDLLKPEILANEGYLFPDTYKINRGKSSGRLEAYTDEIITDLIWKMKTNFEMQISQIFKIDNPDKLKEAIIIASILEKEVRPESDMRLVAGIIKKRMTLGMPIEIDAAVAYGACRRLFDEGKFCDISKVNLVDNIRIDSMYNTYMRKGLPIGPISNPGLRAMAAALNPQPSSFLYYLNAKDGTTIYSKTGLEHQANRKKYLYPDK